MVSDITYLLSTKHPLSRKLVPARVEMAFKFSTIVASVALFIVSTVHASPPPLTRPSDAFLTPISYEISSGCRTTSSSRLSPRALPRDEDNEGKSWSIDDQSKLGVQDDENSPSSKFNFPNPFTELADIFSNFDDVIDDFFNKRMGKGEIFYGKRKYKPSGTVSKGYNGYGFTDRRKIEAAREFREERARLKKERDERVAAEQNERY